jgi:hypothetical protein
VVVIKEVVQYTGEVGDKVDGLAVGNFVGTGVGLPSK